MTSQRLNKARYTLDWYLNNGWEIMSPTPLSENPGDRNYTYTGAFTSLILKNTTRGSVLLCRIFSDSSECYVLHDPDYKDGCYQIDLNKPGA